MTIRYLKTVISAMRPAQWIKNGVVAAAWFFARWDPDQSGHVLQKGAFLHVMLAVAAFCLASSAVYLINDLHDIRADRAHPVKKLRPLASGCLSRRVAVVLFVVLLSAAAVLSLPLPSGFSVVLAGYIVMQLFYTFSLKRVAYVDVFVIAIGFVMRAVAGALALCVRISPWLLLCTFLLALFLALCKRRHEKLQSAESEQNFRESLAGYDARLLDIQIGITAASTLVCYAVYTLSGDTIDRFGTSGLGLTIPFVVFGIFRYLELVYGEADGDRPERVLLSDRTIIITIIGYGLTALGVFLFSNTAC